MRTSVFLTSCFLYFVATFFPSFVSFLLFCTSSFFFLEVSGLSVVRLSVPLSVPRRLQMWPQVIHLEVKGRSHNTGRKEEHPYLKLFGSDDPERQVSVVAPCDQSLHLLYRFLSLSSLFAAASSSPLLSFSFLPRLLCRFFLALCRPLREP